ncbi:hypothetical protein [Massilia sp. YIM B04103]|uniref:hypothetical protein n=1 Tax=Massilia sp. YIM B04103 TaxID=2963106 RepID=UPI002109487E|nr:hypothetical protein [Massilia sp. YIM B04103]
MSNWERLEWSKQVSVLNERIRDFQGDPSPDRLELAIRQLRAYAEAASSGGIEIPAHFIAI